MLTEKDYCDYETSYGLYELGFTVQELRDAEKELETSSESDYDYWLYRVHGLQIKIDVCLNNFKI